MYLAMNRFRIAPEHTDAFEALWRERESYLSEVPGFRSFALLRGPEREDHVLYASHTIWQDQAAFDAWTDSDHFRAAHAQAKAPKGTYLGHPELETFQAVLEE
ncbi:MAG: antibiotic biosynthesis monooxygenase [Pseudomonadota bacterium]